VVEGGDPVESKSASAKGNGIKDWQQQYTRIKRQRRRQIEQRHIQQQVQKARRGWDN
jgi:hypothetical protein